jgi:KDO2-lipid IV(A) lauroyltransferase
MPITESSVLAGQSPAELRQSERECGIPEPLSRFWSPRYLPTWLVLAWLRLTAALPWRWAIWIHKGFGRGVWFLARRRRTIVERNLELCFPELRRAEIEALAKRNFENVSAFIAELSHAWFGNSGDSGPTFSIDGLEHLQAALTRGHGVILLSGHFTALEICVPQIKACVPFFAFMFSPRRNPLLNAMQLKARRKAAHASFASTNVREMIRKLRNNAVVWYAPDQASSLKSGELLHFFGEPAMTSTAGSRIARASGACIVPLFFRRQPDDSGYLLRFEPALDDIPSEDAVADTTRMVQVIEDFVRECPDQYFWTHRKFRGRPESHRPAYARDSGEARLRTGRLAAAWRRLSTPLAFVLAAAKRISNSTGGG